MRAHPSLRERVIPCTSTRRCSAIYTFMSWCSHVFLHVHVHPPGQQVLFVRLVCSSEPATYNLSFPPLSPSHGSCTRSSHSSSGVFLSAERGLCLYLHTQLKYHTYVPQLFRGELLLWSMTCACGCTHTRTRTRIRTNTMFSKT